MKKCGLILFTTISFLLVSVNAFAAVRVCNGADCYYYYSHWLSDKAWGDEVSDFSNAEKVYCNVSAREGGYNPPNYQLRWFKPNGDFVTPTTLVYKYSGGIMVGFYGWLAIEGVYREPGEWRVEHWARGYLEGAGTGWHKLFIAYFTIPSRAMLSISPDSFHFIEFIDSFDSPGSSPTGLTFDGTYLWNADASANKIYKLDLSGTIIDSFDSPGSSPKGLTFDGTYLWVADDLDDKIYKWVTQGVTIGSSVSQTFTIISNGDENLEIWTFTITGTDTSEFAIQNDTCSGQKLTPLETCTFDVVFSPSSAGKKTASLEISSNDVFSPKFVPLSGTGETIKAMPRPWIHLLLLGD